MVNKFFTAAFVLLSCKTTFSQVDKIDSVRIINGHNTQPYFLEGNNLLVVYPPPAYSNAIRVIISEGDIIAQTEIPGYYSVFVPQTNYVTIKVYNNYAANKLLYEKKVPVQVKPLSPDQEKLARLKRKPIVTLAGSHSKTIPKNKLLRVTQFAINSPFSITRATIYLSGINFKSIEVYHLKSGSFSEALLKVWGKVDVGTLITIDEIKVADGMGNNYLINGKFYKVVASD